MTLVVTLSPTRGHTRDVPPDALPPSLAELLELATRTAGEAATVLLDGLRRGGLVVDTKSSATDMVTEIDRAAEALIADALLAARPEDGLVGEEGTNRPTRSGVRWVVDPIDGTTNYLYGHPGFAVSIAAELVHPDPDEGATTVAGVVWVPLLDEVYTATLGGGAHRNNESIGCSTVVDPAGALVASGFAYDPQRRRRQAEVLTRILPRVRDLRRMGAASVDLCSVACGRVDAFYERGLQRWDHAAGALIAREAGATVASLDGGPPSGDCILAANPDLWPTLSTMLIDAGADEA